MAAGNSSVAALPHVERVELAGHIIDSLLLPKILDFITAAGGVFRIEKIAIGHARSDPSYALIEVRAATAERLSQILADIADHGATPVTTQDARLVTADMDGAFPEAFYSTTNQRTEVRLAGKWVEVQKQEMDCGVQVDLAAGTAVLPGDDRCAGRANNMSWVMPACGCCRRLARPRPTASNS